MGVFDAKDQQMLTTAFETALGNYGFKKGGGQQNFNPTPPPGSGTSGQGGTTGQGSGTQSNVGANVNTNAVKKSSSDIAAAVIVAGDAAAKVAEDSAENVLKTLQKVSNAFDKTVFAKLQEQHGFTVEAFGDLEGYANKSQEFAAQEVKSFMNLQKMFFDTGNAYSSYMSEEKFINTIHHVTEEMTDMTFQSLKSFDDNERARMALFATNMDIQGASVAKLLNRTYAETGETSDKILQDITAHATKMSQVSGMSMKDLAGDMAALMENTTDFGFKTAEQASRIASTYKQLGLDLQTFSSLVKGFRDFDTAANKMGDLSAMFGVQMDAMEMMYLANEDEEQFLHRMREQMLDQGVDVENMSNTRLRALSAQMGMSQEQLKTFFREGELIADQTKQKEASAKAEQMGLEETQDIIKSMRAEIPKTTADFKELFKAKEVAKKTADLAKLRLEAGKLSGNIEEATKGLTFEKLGIDATLTKGLEGIVKSVETLNVNIEKGGGFEALGKQLLGTDAKALKPAFASALKASGEAGEEAGKEYTVKYKKGLEPGATPKSLPPMMSPLQLTFDYLAGPGAEEFAGVAAQMGTGFTSVMSAEVEAGAQKANAALETQVAVAQETAKKQLGLSKEMSAELQFLAKNDVEAAKKMAESFGVSYKDLLSAANEDGEILAETLDNMLVKKQTEGKTLAEMMKADPNLSVADALKKIKADKPETPTVTPTETEGGTKSASDTEALSKVVTANVQQVTKKMQSVVETLVAENKALSAKLSDMVKALETRTEEKPINVVVDGNVIAKAVWSSKFTEEALKPS